MAIKQLSVFVENKPGKVLEIVKTLKEANINLRAISIADTKEFGILRAIASDVEAAKKALQDDVLVNVTEVIAAEMKDEAGSLYEVLEKLGEADINVEYMYAFTAAHEELGAYVVLRVDDNDAAEKVLADHGVAVLCQEDMKKF